MKTGSPHGIARIDFCVRYLHFGVRLLPSWRMRLGWEDELGFHFGAP